MGRQPRSEKFHRQRERERERRSQRPSILTMLNHRNRCRAACHCPQSSNPTSSHGLKRSYRITPFTTGLPRFAGFFRAGSGMSSDNSRNVIPKIVKNIVQRIGRPKRDSKQKTLDHYRVRRPRVDLNEDVVDIQGNVVDGNMSQEANVSDVEAIKKKEGERSFFPHWSLKHKWAYPIFGFDGREKCIWCLEFGLKNPFAQEGSSTMGIQALDKHANSNAHKKVMQRWALKSHRDVMPIQKHVELMVDAEKQRIITV
ncbi:hypothetical protein L7F22_048819, partial [Adiantum nelumboides]|nr:hypothetical protein [Adiantum nelumboides]